jgi:antitoxin (DNA-binding transcriptional repressor) of toxin-antitoxin stability system
MPLETDRDCCHFGYVKTVSKRQAAATFESLGSLVHAGETVLVIDGGKPWLKMVPAKSATRGKSAAAFKARLARISRKPIHGVTEILQRTRR